jgi:hypothetical protein
MQFRISLVYLGVVASPLGIQGSAASVRTALLAVARYVLFGAALVLFPWPRVITYLAAIMVGAQVIESALLLLRIGERQVAWTAKGRRYRMWLEAVAVGSRAMIFAGVAYFVGF